MLVLLFFLTFSAYYVHALTPNQKINATVIRVVSDLNMKLEIMTQEFITDQKTKKDLTPQEWNEIEIAAKAYNDDLMKRFSKRVSEVLLARAFKVADIHGQVNIEAIQNTQLMIQQLSKAWVEEVNEGIGLYRRSQMVPYSQIQKFGQLSPQYTGQGEKQMAQKVEKLIMHMFPTNSAHTSKQQFIKWLENARLPNIITILKHHRILNADPHLNQNNGMKIQGLIDALKLSNLDNSAHNLVSEGSTLKTTQHMNSEVSSSHGSIMVNNVPEILEYEAPKLVKVSGSGEDKNRFVLPENTDDASHVSSDSSQSVGDASHSSQAEGEGSELPEEKSPPKKQEAEPEIPPDLKEKNEERAARMTVNNIGFWEEFLGFFRHNLIRKYTKIFFTIGFFYMIYDLSLKKEHYPELL